MKIILVDDDSLVCQSLKTIVEASGVQVLATGSSADEAVRLYHEHQPDVLILDIRMGEKSGLDAAREILEKDEKARILLLTTFKDQSYISEALALGCRGYLLKQNFASILPSIKAVYAGSFVFDSEVIDSLSKRPELAPDDRLTEQENELVSLVAEGMNNKEIAKELNLSEGTVRNYLSEILNKLQLRDRTQLAVAYYKRLLDAEGL